MSSDPNHRRGGQLGEIKQLDHVAMLSGLQCAVLIITCKQSAHGKQMICGSLHEQRSACSAHMLPLPAALQAMVGASHAEVSCFAYPQAPASL